MKAKPSCALTITFLAVLSPLALAADATKTSAELWISGDDALTQGFAQSLRGAIARSRDFRQAPGSSRGSVVLTVPTHVYWKEAQGRVNFQYVVIFTTQDSRYLGAAVHSCWKDEMTRCSDRVLSDLRLALTNDADESK